MKVYRENLYVILSEDVLSDNPHPINNKEFWYRKVFIVPGEIFYMGRHGALNNVEVVI